MPNDARLDDPETLKAMLLAERVQNGRLPQIIKELQRHRFGRRPETLPEDQVLLGVEEVEQAEANRAVETDGALPSERRARAHKRRINRRALPGHLPRLIEAVCRPRRRAQVLVSKYADHLPLYRQARFTPAKGSIWIGRRWQTGSVMPFGTFVRCLSSLLLRLKQLSRPFADETTSRPSPASRF
jgi:hypothetical protein